MSSSFLRCSFLCLLVLLSISPPSQAFIPLHPPTSSSPPRHSKFPTTTTLVPPLHAGASASSSSSLPPEQILSYLRDGHTVARNLFSSQELQSVWTPQIMAAFESERLEALRHEIQVFFGEEAYEACATMEQCMAKLEEKDEEDITPFLQVFNLWRRHPTLKPLIHSKPLAQIAAALLGCPRVRLYQDSLFVKRPGDDPTLFHTDLGTAPLDTNDFITAWIPLTEIASVEKGGSPLQFCKGSHRDMAFQFWYDPHESDDEERLRRYEVVDYAPLGVGDVTFHHGWCLHGSPGNKAEGAKERVALTVCFVNAEARVMDKDVLYFPDEEDSLSYSDWIEEVGIGQVIDHPLTPIVYP